MFFVSLEQDSNALCKWYLELILSLVFLLEYLDILLVKPFFISIFGVLSLVFMVLFDSVLRLLQEFKYFLVELVDTIRLE